MSDTDGVRPASLVEELRIESVRFRPGRLGDLFVLAAVRIESLERDLSAAFEGRYALSHASNKCRELSARLEDAHSVINKQRSEREDALRGTGLTTVGALRASLDQNILNCRMLETETRELCKELSKVVSQRDEFKLGLEAANTATRDAIRERDIAKSGQDIATYAFAGASARIEKLEAEVEQLRMVPEGESNE